MTENATVTVAYGGQSITIELDGVELSATQQANGSIHRYFTNASREFVAEQVRDALIALTPEPEVPA